MQSSNKLIAILAIGIVTIVAITLIVIAASPSNSKVSAANLPSGVIVAEKLPATQGCIIPANCPTATAVPPTPTPLPPTALPPTPTPQPQSTATPEPTATPTPEPPTPTPTPLSDPIMPKRLRIPSIGVDSSIEYVGLTKDGAMDTPKNFFNTAWYKLGAKPGDVGNAVIAGHVDMVKGPAIFWDLKKLKPGNKIFVDGDNGKELTFEVFEAETYPYDSAPLDKIFGPSNQANLNLITCTGVFDRSANNYDQRLVVYAKLVPNS